MPIQIHIDELILHDFDLPESHGITFERALTSELGRLLATSDLPATSFAAPQLSLPLTPGPASPMSLGTQAAGAIASLGSPCEGSP